VSRVDQKNPGMPRRTVVVWTTLILSMTLISGLLLLLEPSQIPRIAQLEITDPFGNFDDTEALFNTDESLSNRWQGIVIHHSGQTHGDAAMLDRQHRVAGDSQGLRYHFVIGNGDGASDGSIQISPRWREQVDAAHQSVSPWYDHHAIAICLIGNGDRNTPSASQMQQLVRLTTALQKRLKIAPEQVVMQANVSGSTSPGVRFPASQFRRQLISLPAIP
jgi:hypothetical protein